MDRNKIFKLIQTMVEQKSFMSGQIPPEHKIPNLYPIESVYQGYSSPDAVAFKPHKDFGKGYKVASELLLDDGTRFEEITKLNTHIDEYNEWVDEQNVHHKKEVFDLNLQQGIVHNLSDYNLKTKEYFKLGHLPIWSFMAERKLPKQRTTWNNILSTTFHINDEELYTLNMEDPDFLIKINKTISEYINREICEGMERNISAGRSIWYEPNIRFVTWSQTHPSDAKPYELNTKDVITKTDSTDDLYYIAEDCSDMHEQNKIKFPTKRDAYRWWSENYTQNGKDVTVKMLEDAYSRGKRRGKYDRKHNKPLLDKS